jgi:hypothetical protein
MITGGCLCGTTRYQIDAEARFTSFCHCQDCRKASGAPVVAWTFFPAGSLSWTDANPKTLVFADRERTFCPECGTPLSFFDPAIPDEFEVTTCSLDHPENFPPQDHNWMLDRVPWFDSADSLPRHETHPPS